MIIPFASAGIHCVVEGSGQAVLVMGSVGSRYLEVGLARLGANLQLVFIELRGHRAFQPGRRTASRSDPRRRRRRATHLGIDRAIAFGHSINGQLALALAARHAGSISHVVAVGTPPPGDQADLSETYFEAHAPADLREARSEFRRLQDAGAPEEQVLAAWDRFDRLRRWHDRDYDPAPLQALYDPRPDWARTHMLELLPAYRLDERLAAITCPVLLAMGASDFLVPPSLWEAGTRPPRTTVEIFERSGHTPFVEEAEVFERRLLDWLARASIP